MSAVILVLGFVLFLAITQRVADEYGTDDLTIDISANGWH